MRPPTTFKKEFLKNWLMGLKLCSSSMKNMSFLQRKNIIKLSADIAMASTRDGKTIWSKTLIQKASKQGDEEDNQESKILVYKMLANSTNKDFSEKLRMNKISTTTTGSFMRSKNILRRSRSSSRIRSKCASSRSSQRVIARSIAKRLMVKKKTEVLKSLVPGGEAMNNDFTLLEETLDYIFSLRAQVDVMRRLANASSEVSDCK